jgi:hypothetical protein
MTNNLPEPDDAPWLNLSQEEINQLRYDKQKLTDYGREKIRALMEEKKLLKECRQTGRTTATTEKVLKTVFSQMKETETDTSKVLKEMENQKSPVQEAFKKVYGYYPDFCERSVWIAFKKGYGEGQEDCKVVEEPKPKKLFEVLLNLGYSYDMCYEIVDAVKECLPDEHYSDGEDYDLGFNDCLNKIKDGLR